MFKPTDRVTNRQRLKLSEVVRRTLILSPPLEITQRFLLCKKNKNFFFFLFYKFKSTYAFKSNIDTAFAKVQKKNSNTRNLQASAET